MTGYVVEITYMANGFWSTYSPGTTSTSLDVTAAVGPSCATSGCSVRVFAKSATGVMGAPSNRAVIGPMPNTAVGGPPGDLTATRTVNDQVDLTWSLPTTGSAIVGVEVTSGDGQHWMVSGTSLSSIGSLPCPSWSTCSFTVAALNAGGIGLSSVSVSVGPVALPSAPTNLVASRTVNDQVDLTWSLPTTGSAIVGVEVTSGDGQHWMVSGTSLSSIGSLPCPSWSTCSFTVAALNAGGIGLSSVSVSVGPVALPRNPTGLSVSLPYGIPSLNWTAPAGSVATSYRITSDTGVNWTVFASPALVSCPLAGSCGFSVRSANAAGESQPTKVTLLNSAPTAPAISDAKLLANGSTQVSFTPSSSLGNGTLLGYDLYWSYAGADGVEYPAVYGGRSAATATSAPFVCPFSLVFAGSTCRFVVAAVNEFGSSNSATKAVSYAPPRPTKKLVGYRQHDAHAGDPVSMATGNLTGEWTDLSAPEGAWSMSLSRSYNSRDPHVGVLGAGWSTLLDTSLILNGDGSYTFRDRDGREVDFTVAPTGGWVRPEEMDAVLSVNPTGPVLTWFSGEVWQFDLTGVLVSQTGWEGQTVTIGRTAGLVTSIVSSSGYSLTLTYTTGRLTGVTSSTGRSVAYAFNAASAMTSVTVDGRLVQAITPDGSGRLQQLADPTGVALMSNTFDGLGRVTLQSSAAGSPVSFVYSSTVERDITVMTDTATGAVSRFEFDKGGRLLNAVDPNGFATSASYDIAGNRTAADSRSGTSTSSAFDDSGRPTQVVTDAAGSTGIVYDTSGRVASMTDMFGRLTTYAYDGAERLPSSTTASDGTITTANIVNGLVMSTTDADGVTLSYTYDAQRRPATTTDAYGHVTTLTYSSKGQLETVKDPTGAITTNGYDAYGRLISVTDPLSRVSTYTYDNADRLLTVKDSTGAITTNTYDVAGRLATVTDPVGSVVSYTYDTAGRLKTEVAPGNAITTYTYDVLNRVATVMDPLGRVVSFGYDADGHRTKVTDPTGAVTLTSFDGAGRPVSVRDPLGRVSRNIYDSFGRLTSVVDPAGQSTVMTYDNRDRLATTTDPRGAISSTTYTLAGRVKTQTAPTGLVTTNIYDLAGRRSKTTGPTGETLFGFDQANRVNSVTTPGLQNSTVTFDPLGRVMTTTDPAGVVTTNTWTDRGELKTTGVTGAGTVAYVYNPDRTLKQVTDANLKVTAYGYDGRKNRTTITNANNGVDTTAFDLANQPFSVKDPLARETMYTYDPAGRVASVTDPTNRKLSYTFDLAGQVTTKAVTGGNTYQYGYDTLGRRTTVTTAGQTWATVWDPGNVLTARTDPNGRTTRWVYDTAGRMTGLTYPDGSTINYTYDTASRLSTIRPGEVMADNFTATTGTVLDAGKWTPTLTAGATASVQTNSARLATANIATSAVVETSKAANTAEVDARFTYTAADTTAVNSANLVIAGRKTASNEYRLTLPSIGGTAVVAKKVGTVITPLASFPIPGAGARTVRFQIQGTHVRTKVWQTPLPEPTAWTTDTVDTAITTAGQTAVSFTRVAGLNSVTIDDFTQTNPTTPPVATAIYGYNADSQYTGETLNGGSRTWTYVTGRLSNYSQTLGTTTTATAVGYDTSGRLKTETTGTLTKTYGYDLASELKSVTPSTGSATTYTYDNLGRRASVKVGTAAATIYAYDASSQLLTAGTTSYAYDVAGRRTTETVGTTVTGYSYDPQGRLASNTRGTTTVTRGYDPDDNLTSVTNGATVTGIDWDPTSGLPQPTILGGNRYIRGPDGALSSRTGLVDTNLGRDMYGSIISPTGNARATGYDAFGAPTGTNTWTPTLGYRGEIVIDSLSYLRARNYDTSKGVFTSRDPLGGAAGTPVTANPYHYGNNNPLMNLDPTGMSNVNDNLFQTTSDGSGNSYQVYGDQVKIGGQWVNQNVYLAMVGQQAHAEGAAADANADRLDAIGPLGFSIAYMTSAAAGIVCGGLAVESGPVGMGAAATTCAGAADRFVMGRFAGDDISTSLSAAFNPEALAGDAVTGALLGGAAGALGGAVKAVASRVPAVDAALTKLATEAGMRGAGDGYAGRVLDGGRVDGQTVFAGHGEYRYGAGTTAVPEGTSVNVYAPHGQGIPDSLGGAIETGGQVPPYQVYGPGSQIPNYTLKTPDGLTVYSGSTTVQASTPLSELLQPGMGTCHWAACVSVR